MDGGDLLTGRPYGYTEEYQSYEQTGTEQYQTGTTQVPVTDVSDGRCLSSCKYFWGTWEGSGGVNICKYDNEGAPSQYDNIAMCNRTVSRPTYGTRPVYGYVTRTRTITYDKQSGLFSIGIGVPYAARNTGLYSTRKRSIEHLITYFSVGIAKCYAYR